MSLDEPQNQLENWKKKIYTFLASQTISMFGSSLVQYAIIWHVTRETNSGVMVTLLTISSFLPNMLISPFAGVWADRYNRKLLIILSDSIIAISTLVLALLFIAGHREIWLMCIVAAIRSLGSGVQSPSCSALIPQLIPRDKLLQINGIHSSMQSFVNLLAPAFGGFVLSFSSIQNIMFIDIITAIIGVTMLATLHIPLHQKTTDVVHNGYFTEFKEGLTYAFKNTFVKQLLIFNIFFTFMIVPPALLNMLFVTRYFGDSYVYLALNEMSFFIGSILGGILIASWGGFKNKLTTVCVACAAFGALTIVIGMMNIFWIYLVIMVFIGVTMPAFNSPVNALLQEKVAPDMQGRVFSIVQIGFVGVMQLGMVIYGPLADIVSLKLLIVINGVLLLIMGIVQSRNKKFITEGFSKPITE